MLVNQWRQISLVPEEGYRIIAAEVGSHNQNVSVQITTGEWTCEIFGNESTTTTIVFEVEIEDEYGAGWTVFVYVNVMVLDINTALNVLQPELPDLMFAIRQNELLRFV